MLVVLNGVKGRQTIDKQIHKELSMAENEGAAVAVDNAAVPTNEWERMLSGELYICGDMQREANMRKRRLVHAINTSAYDAFEERDRLFRELFGSLGKGAFLEPPFNCDYGCNTYIGDNFYANIDCIFLDVARITIGNDVWFGGSVVVCPDVTIGDDVVIGAGSVVTKDIPSHSVAVGNPCHVIRKITDADREYWEGKAAEYRAWKDSL